MRVNIDYNANEFIVVDWAYEENPGSSIFAGVLDPSLIPPEPYLFADIMGSVYTDFPIEVNFTEPVTGFEISDIVVTGGSPVPGSFTTTDNQHFEVLIHPEVEGTIEIKIPGSVAEDADGNLNMPGAYIGRISYVEVPKPVLSTEIEQPVNEPVSGLEESDFVITNGTLNTGSLNTVSDSLYTIMVTPVATGDVLIDLPMSVVVDEDSHDNFAAETLTVEADFDSPRTELHFDATEPVTGVFTVSIDFTEAVSDFEEYEVDITNGYPSAGTLHTEDNIAFTLDIIPEASGNVIIHVPANVAHDDDDFSNLASNTLTVAVDLPNDIYSDQPEGFACYPNPNQGIFTLEIPEAYQGSLLQVYNSSGLMIYESVVEQQQNTLDLTAMSKGMYLIKLMKNNNQITHRLIIE